MGKIRIYELAKELHQDSKTIIGQLKQMDVNVSNHMSTIDSESADKIRALCNNQAQSGNSAKEETAIKELSLIHI